MDQLIETAGQAQGAPEIGSAIAEARALALEQVAAAWQLHLDRVREQLDAGWRDSLEMIIDQRFQEIEDRLREGFEAAVSERARIEAERSAAFVRDNTRRELTDSLNNAVRRMKQAETYEDWASTLLDATTEFCGKAAVFAVGRSTVRFEGARGALEKMNIEIPLSSAPALASAVESMDTVVAAGTPRELSQAVSDVLGDLSGQKVYLFPVIQERRAVAILYAEPSEQGIDVSALELLTSLAPQSSKQVEPASAPRELVQLSGVAAPPPPLPTTPAAHELAGIPKPEQAMHLYAQRFARTRVAELVLRRMPAIREGRSTGNLYGTLKDEIDAGREAFRRQFIDTCPSMVDYYHRELVRTVAKHEAGILGPHYPGPLR